MIKSLCSKYPCPSLCSRVEHCPAGQERIHWLWLVRRGERGQLSRRPLYPRPESEARAFATLSDGRQVNTTTGEISKARTLSSKLKEGFFYNVFGPEKYPRTHRPFRYGRRLWKPYASCAALTALLLFIGVVVGIGLLLNGGDFAPGYEPPSTPAWYEWR